MTIQYLPKFKKQYQKLPAKFQEQFDNRLRLFVIDPTVPQLRIHPLRGHYAGYWSMNVNGDLRAIYLKRGDEILIFALIGTHSELYG
ncbi:type II toxin-antitoxin system mRNA interferase toxin, RelE/StbE family [Candidatus Saccharibacteria bacterium]|nr:type II toxin-antitoxin system mRNA interferase toxin, RelE/StbE family [Candidatus Saccharibacteria bacterium]